MEKKAVEPFKNQYVKLVKDTSEILNGSIVDISDDAVLFQTELKCHGIALGSIREIIPHTSKKRSPQTNNFKV